MANFIRNSIVTMLNTDYKLWFYPLLFLKEKPSISGQANFNTKFNCKPRVYILIGHNNSLWLKRKKTIDAILSLTSVLIHSVHVVWKYGQLHRLCCLCCFTHIILLVWTTSGFEHTTTSSWVQAIQTISIGSYCSAAIYIIRKHFSRKSLNVKCN